MKHGERERLQRSQGGAGAEMDFLPAKGVLRRGREGKAWHWQGFLFLTWSPGAVELNNSPASVRSAQRGNYDMYVAIQLTSAVFHNVWPDFFFFFYLWLVHVGFHLDYFFSLHVNDTTSTVKGSKSLL